MDPEIRAHKQERHPILLGFLLLGPGSVPHPTKELTGHGTSPSRHCASVGTGQAYTSLLLPPTMNLRISKPWAVLGTQLQKTEPAHSQSMLWHCPLGVRC